MGYILASIFGLLGGALCAYLLLEAKRRKMKAMEDLIDERESRLRDGQRVLKDQEWKSHEELKSRRADVDKLAASLREELSQFQAQVISYKELKSENAILKRDLNNIDVNLRKLELDRDQQRENQEQLTQRCTELAERYLKECEKWIGASLNANNFSNCKGRLLDVLERCRGIGFEIPPEKEAELIGELREDFEKAVRAAFEREEQSRIKAQIREEQLREKEVEKELKQLERERAAIQAALEKALAEAKDEHSAEIENLKARLKEAEERSQRAISQAQITKSGHVYVISNVGSFGDGVFKIGMTRRLEPLDRVKELGDASVPFPFDIHMMISCDDAPALENAIHRTLHKLRINKINLRKEFFRTEFDEIRRIVEENHGRVDYVADAEALEFRQSASMTDDDQEFIEGVYDKLEDDGNGTDEN